MTERRFQASSRRASIAQLVRTFLAGLLPIFMTQKPRNAGAEKLGDDEFAIEFGDGPIGLDLTEVRFPFGVPAAKQSSRVIVDAVKPGSQADILGKKYRLRPQVLLVSVNGKNVEGLRAKDVIKLVIDSKKEADEYEGGTLRLVFRDPLLFKEKLLNSQEGSVVETQVGVFGRENLINTHTNTHTLILYTHKHTQTFIHTNTFIHAGRRVGKRKTDCQRNQGA